MKHVMLTLIISALAATGCASTQQRAPAATPATEPETTSVAPVSIERKMGADSDMTQPKEQTVRRPLDQAGDAMDLKITKQIRGALMADDNLSFPAKNIDITTDDRKVTLRGAVKTAEERNSVESKARQVDSVREVDNEVVITQ